MLSEILLTVNEWSSIFLSFIQKELLYSSILFLIVLGFTRVLKKKSLYLQYGLWALVLLRLVLPPDFSLQFSARSVLDTFGFGCKTSFRSFISSTRSPGLQTVRSIRCGSAFATIWCFLPATFLPRLTAAAC